MVEEHENREGLGTPIMRWSNCLKIESYYILCQFVGNATKLFQPQAYNLHLAYNCPNLHCMFCTQIGIINSLWVGNYGYMNEPATLSYTYI